MPNFNICMAFETQTPQNYLPCTPHNLSLETRKRQTNKRLCCPKWGEKGGSLREDYREQHWFISQNTSPPRENVGKKRPGGKSGTAQESSQQRSVRWTAAGCGEEPRAGLSVTNPRWGAHGLLCLPSMPKPTAETSLYVGGADPEASSRQWGKEHTFNDAQRIRNLSSLKGGHGQDVLDL